jgi:hypothetical protein
VRRRRGRIRRPRPAPWASAQRSPLRLARRATWRVTASVKAVVASHREQRRLRSRPRDRNRGKAQARAARSNLLRVLAGRRRAS